MSFKVGDRVKIVRENSGTYLEQIGKTTSIRIVHSGGGYDLVGIPGTNWLNNELQLVNKKGSNMPKFYKLVKDTPALEEGAILEESSSDDEGLYRPISDLWDTLAAEKCENYWESSDIIENSPEWYVRVYKVGVLGKSKYLVKTEARKAHAELHKTRRV